MGLKRLLKHLLTSDLRAKRAFGPATLDAIEAAVRRTEQSHDGQIRFVVEAALDPFPLWRRLKTPRERAVEVFSLLRVWDTERNNGILLYVLMADRAVEIVCDRGINAQADSDAWRKICDDIDAHFHQGRFQEGAVKGVEALSALLQRHFPGSRGRNDLPDRPELI